MATTMFSPNRQLVLLLCTMFLVQASEQLFSQPSTRNSNVYTPFGQPSSPGISNYTAASHYATPYYYELERDPRLWLSGLGGGGAGGYGYSPFSYGGSSLFSGGGIEAAVVCLLVVVGIGVIGLPMLLLVFSMFNNNMSNNPSGGFNFIPPTSTTTVTGRRRRSAETNGTQSGTVTMVDRLARRLVELGKLGELSSMMEVGQLADQLLVGIRPELRHKAMDHLKNFAQAKDKIEYLKKLMQ